MPNKLVSYLSGGIFVLVVTVLGASISQILLKQDRVVSFEAPMKEFTDGLNRELGNNVFSLRALAQLFHSSQNVESHEFNSFADLLMEQYQHIEALTYLNGDATDEALVLTYWEAAGGSATLVPEQALRLIKPDDLRRDLEQGQQVVSSGLFKVNASPHYYAFVMQRLAGKPGFIGLLVNVSFVLERSLNNELNQGYFLYEVTNGKPRFMFGRYGGEEQGNDNLDGDYLATLSIFNREWLLSVYQNRAYEHQLVYTAIPVACFALSVLVVYLVALASRLRAANRVKQRAFDDLLFAQHKLVESEKITAMGGIVAGVAHEVNTPIGIGVTCMSHLQESMQELREDFNRGRLDTDKFQEFMEGGDELVKLCLSNLQKASKLVARFKKVDVSNTSAELDCEEVMMGQLIDRFIERFYDEHPGTKVVINTNIDPGINVYTYPSVILDVLSYLGANAVAHAFTAEQENCQITISYPFNTKDKKRHLLFKDNGIGVAKADLSRIVDPFFTTKRGAGYAGLGLSVAYNLVKGKLATDLNYFVEDGLGLSFEIKDLHK